MARRKAAIGSSAAEGADTLSQLIEAKIAELGDWRGETLARVRSLIREADPDVVEEIKWRKPSRVAVRWLPCEFFNGILGFSYTKQLDSVPPRPGLDATI